MARVTIRVECDGGSTTEITEQSAVAIYGGEQAAILAQEAFVRTCRSLGVREETPAQPDPEPPASAPATTQDTTGEQAEASVAEALSKTNRKAA